MRTTYPVIIIKGISSVLMITALLMVGKNGQAQTNTEELKAAQEHWWIDYANGLKKVIAEKNDHQAAMLLQKIKEELIPRFSKLVKDTQAWKKSHSQAELQKMAEWNESNPHNQEVQSLQLHPDILMRTGKNKEFQQAYADLLKAMRNAGK